LSPDLEDSHYSNPDEDVMEERYSLKKPYLVDILAESFCNVKNVCHLLRQKVRQRISVMKTATALVVFFVFKTKRE
jgi:hypothetical protein